MSETEMSCESADEDDLADTHTNIDLVPFCGKHVSDRRRSEREFGGDGVQ
jgi:hypothetical protein